MQRWRGIALVGVISAVALWLAASGRLVLYIHPRYIVFTVVMAAIALAFVVAAIAVRASAEPEPLPSRRERALGMTAVVVAAAFAIGMIAIPPATLSTATAQQRQINATAGDVDALDSADSADASTIARFTVREWAGVLRQTSDLGFFADKPVTELVGFVAPDPDDPENVFYVSRFVITCCAVDAQPLGVPVHRPGWQQEFAVDSWVSVTGEFGANPSATSPQPIVVLPDSVEAVEQPSEPYLF